MASMTAATQPLPTVHPERHAPPGAGGEKTKARDILAAIRTLQRIEQEQRPATPEERQALARFSGFGPVALSLFPDPVTGRYKDATWRAHRRRTAVAAHARRNTTAPSAPPSTPSTPRPRSSRAMHEALARLGVPSDATVLEPGCGTGNFMRAGPAGHALHRRRAGPALRPHRPGAAPRRTTSASRTSATRSLPEDRIDAVIGNVPFADVKLDYRRQASVAARFLLRQVRRRAEARRRAGAGHQRITRSTSRTPPSASTSPSRPISWARSACPPTPSSARARRSSPTSCSCASVRPAKPPSHADPAWLRYRAARHRRRRDSRSTAISCTIPRWCWAPGAARTGSTAARRYSVTGNGDLAEQLREAIGAAARGCLCRRRPAPSPSNSAALPARRRWSGTSPKAASSSATTRPSCQVAGGEAVPVIYGGRALKADGTHDRQAAWPP